MTGTFYSLATLALLATACADRDAGPRFGTPTTIAEPVAAAPADEDLPFPAGDAAAKPAPAKFAPLESELAIDRLLASEADRGLRDLPVRELAFRTLAFRTAGSMCGPHRETVRATAFELHRRRGVGGSFGTGDETTETLATLALLGDLDLRRTGRFEEVARTAPAAFRFDRRDDSERLALKALGVAYYVRPEGEGALEETRTRLRTIVDERWEAARRSGGTPLAALVLVRLLLDDPVRQNPGMKDALDQLLEEGPPVTDGRIAEPIRLFLLDTVFWRVFWWNRGDRERGERWKKARRAAVLPLRGDLTSEELAVIATGLAGDEVACVYGGFLTVLVGWR